MNEPRISIITPVFNEREALEKAIESVAAQRYRPFEHLIIDGASTDGSAEMVRELRKKYKHLRLVTEKDSGVYNAMNKGLDLMKGDWVYFLGSDDRLYDNDVLADLVEMGVFNEEQVVYGNVFIEGDTFWANNNAVYDGPFDLEKLFKRNLCHQSIFYPASVVRQIGHYNEKYDITADWDYNFRCYARYPFRYVERIIAWFRTGGKSSGGGDNSFYEDLPDNIVRYFGIDPESEQYANFNSPFFYPVSRYREKKQRQKIHDQGAEIGRVYDMLARLRADHDASFHEMRSSYEAATQNLVAAHSNRESALFREFAANLSALSAGQADTLTRVENAHAGHLEKEKEILEETLGELSDEKRVLREVLGGLETDKEMIRETLGSFEQGKDLFRETLDRLEKEKILFLDTAARLEQNYTVNLAGLRQAYEQKLAGFERELATAREQLATRHEELRELQHRKDLEMKELSHRKETETTILLSRKETELRENQHRREKELLDQLHRKETEFTNMLNHKEKEFFELLHRKEMEFVDHLGLKEKEFGNKVAALVGKAEHLERLIASRDQQMEEMTRRYGEDTARLQAIIEKHETEISILYHSYRYKVGDFLVSPFTRLFGSRNRKPSDEGKKG